MIDTDWDIVNDVAVNADGGKYYLSTTDTSEGSGAYDTSIWVKDGGTWYRILNQKDFTTDTDADYLVRTAPEDDTAVYIASLGTQNVWVSKNSGMESWKQVTCYKILSTDGIVDIAVENADVVYALGGTSGVSKTVNAGASWGTAKKPTEGLKGYMITLASNGDVFVGDTDGYIAYSKDGGATFERTSDYGSGNPVVLPDDGYDSNNVIYVGIGTSVKRGSASTAPLSPTATKGTVSSSLKITGMGQAGGVVYVLAANSTQDSILYAAQNLEKAADSTEADWSNTGGISGEVYNAGRNTLRVSEVSGAAKLWAIDTASNDLESFDDKVSLAAPTITAPDDGTVIQVNIKSGGAYDITFTYKRYSDTDVNSSLLQIATDPDFNAILKTDTITSITADTIATTIGPNTNGAGIETTNVNYLPGTTYYWRVRTTSPLNSPWSAVRSFTMQTLEEPFSVSGPAVGAGDVSIMPTLTWAEYEEAIKYQVEICELPDFAILELSANTENPFYTVSADDALDYSTTYYWRVRGVTAEPYLVGRSWVTPAGPWVTGVFTTGAEPVVEEDPDPIIITEPGETVVEIVEVPVTTTPVIPTYLLWVIVGVGAILVIALIVLIVRTRRVA
jgi:hypothetical protein